MSDSTESTPKEVELKASESTPKETSSEPTKETEPPATESTPKETEPPATESTPKETEPPATESTPKETEPPATESTPKETEPPATESTPKETKSTDDESKTDIEVVPEPPKPKEYTPEEITEIAKRVMTPTDQTPSYNPKHILTKAYEGTSNYEVALDSMLQDTKKRLKDTSKLSTIEIKQLKKDLKTLEYLYQNYHVGMNVFRTAKGGRSKIRV